MSRRRLVQVAASFLLAGLGAACSPPTLPPTGPDANAPAAGPTGCLEVRRWPDNPGVIDHTRKAWDATRRILTAETSPSATFDKIWTLQWRYASEGRILAYAGLQPDAFQHDFRYDSHDNLIEMRASYPDRADVTTPSSSASTYATVYANEYDPAGRLLTSTVTMSGGIEPRVVKRTYTEEAGRCTKIVSVGPEGTQEEVRSYDDAGRLIRSEQTGGYRPSSTAIVYDDKGRVDTLTIAIGGNVFPGVVTVRHTYGADGSEDIDHEDSSNDVLSQRHHITARTPACLEIDAAVGAPSDARCRAQ